MSTQPKATKVFNDPIHGNMEFPPLCVRIIDTPQFQRLRYLKQLGCGYFVYPDASHNRFEHSLGVCHLAGLLVKELRSKQDLGIEDKQDLGIEDKQDLGTEDKQDLGIEDKQDLGTEDKQELEIGDKQPTLRIEDNDVLCVQIAGLCHDLGHGPFSHVFDNKFIAETRPDKKWKHEEASLAMFGHLVKENGLESEITSDEIETIKELIIGKDPSKNDKPEWKYRNEPLFRKKEWTYTGEKAFLYEIVANKRNGVDVDKWDYFQRDSHHLGMTSSFDLMRFIKFACVITVGGESQICYRDKEAFNVYQLFHTRFTLHRRAYQHKTVQAVELMLVDAMKEADGDDGKGPISGCIDDMDAYTHLTDDIFHRILRGELGEGSNAKKILEDIQKRRLYRCVGEIVVPILPSEFRPDPESPEEIEKKIKKELDGKIKQKLADVAAETIRIQVSTFDYGNKAENPVSKVGFYRKNKPDRQILEYSKAAEVSFLVPKFCFQEKLVRVFYRQSDQEEAGEDENRMKKISETMKEWCEEKKREMPQAGGQESQAGSKFEKFVDHVCRTFCPEFRSMVEAGATEQDSVPDTGSTQSQTAELR